jgi:predicted metal-dependent phosphotriesterase family hydrolase
MGGAARLGRRPTSPHPPRFEQVPPVAHVQTVLGPIPADALGRVMMHEHLLSLLPGPWPGSGDDELSPVELAVRALSGLRDRGFGTVVDLSPYNVVGRDAEGRNSALLAEISGRSGLHVVSGTALYLDSWTPSWAAGLSTDDLAERLIADIEIGIGNGTVRAGILGEQATGLDRMTAHEERTLRAAARASVRTGVAIMTHTTHGTLALDQIDILVDEGVDLARVVIGHLDTQLDPDLPRQVLATGACVAVDTIGKQEWDFFLGPAGEREDGEFAKHAFHRGDEGRADLVAGLVADGFVDRIVLAQDLTGAEIWMNPDTHGQHGYRYLHEVFRPLLLERGVTDQEYDRMLVSTPARLLEVAG